MERSSFGIDLDQTFNLVHESNMSKVCKNMANQEKQLTTIVNTPIVAILKINSGWVDPVP